MQKKDKATNLSDNQSGNKSFVDIESEEDEEKF